MFLHLLYALRKISTDLKLLFLNTFFPSDNCFAGDRVHRDSPMNIQKCFCFTHFKKWHGFCLEEYHILFKLSFCFLHFNYNIYKNNAVASSVTWSLHKCGIIFLGLVPSSFADDSKLALGLTLPDGPHGLAGKYHFS